jgi:hypothetical protein
VSAARALGVLWILAHRMRTRAVYACATELGVAAIRPALLGVLHVRSLKKIAVIGDQGNASVIATGHGSGEVTLPYLISPLQAILQRFEGTYVLPDCRLGRFHTWANRLM